MYVEVPGWDSEDRCTTGRFSSSELLELSKHHYLC